MPTQAMLRILGPILLLTALALVVSACSGSLSPPPIDVEFRDSLVDLGEIARLTNTSKRPLSNVRVKVKNPDDDVKHYTVESLAPGDTVEVGWKKLEGFRIERGARLTLRCDGYLLPKIVQLAAGPDRSGALIEDR